MILTLILLFYLHLKPLPAPDLLLDGREWDSSAGSVIIGEDQ